MSRLWEKKVNQIPQLDFWEVLEKLLIDNHPGRTHWEAIEGGQCPCLYCKRARALRKLIAVAQAAKEAESWIGLDMCYASLEDADEASKAHDALKEALEALEQE